jgi:hypothetical protein
MARALVGTGRTARSAGSLYAHPRLDVFSDDLPGDIVDQERPSRPPVVRTRDGAERLLPRLRSRVINGEPRMSKPMPIGLPKASRPFPSCALDAVPDRCRWPGIAGPGATRAEQSWGRGALLRGVCKGRGGGGTYRIPDLQLDLFVVD